MQGSIKYMYKIGICAVANFLVLYDSQRNGDQERDGALWLVHKVFPKHFETQDLQLSIFKQDGKRENTKYQCS